MSARTLKRVLIALAGFCLIVGGLWVQSHQNDPDPQASCDDRLPELKERSGLDQLLVTDQDANYPEGFNLDCWYEWREDGGQLRATLHLESYTHKTVQEAKDSINEFAGFIEPCGLVDLACHINSRDDSFEADAGLTYSYFTNVKYFDDDPEDTPNDDPFSAQEVTVREGKTVYMAYIELLPPDRSSLARNNELLSRLAYGLLNEAA